MTEKTEFLKNGLIMKQAPEVFKIGTDALFLSDFVRLKPRSKVLEMGTGSAVISLLMSDKSTGLRITAIDNDPNALRLAAENVSANGLEECISIVDCDFGNITSRFGHGFFDAVVTNPPYFRNGSGKVSAANAMAAARHEKSATLETIVSETSKVIKYGGEFFIVYPADKLALLTETLCRYNLIPKRLRLFCPKPDSAAVICAVMAKKGAAHSLLLEPSLFQFGQDGRETEEYQKLSVTERSAEGCYER